jgi:excinuclease ABC subunit C
LKNDKLKDIVSSLPGKPGVYQYFDENGKIIYVGKAKNLKKRVSSYFTKHHDTAKLRILVSKIADIKPIVVDREEDALLLENNLIKKYQPRYNVMLKDDKTFPWICIKNEPFPRVFSTRNVIKDGSEYFGPYTSVKMVKAILDFIHRTYKVRTCSLNLNSKDIAEGKFKVCLEHHIGNCKAPCEGLQSEQEYMLNIDHIRQILKGNIKEAINWFEKEMKRLASEYQFEEAEDVKQKLMLLRNYQSKSTIVNPTIHNVDVFSLYEGEKAAYVNFLKVSNGAIIQSHTVEIKRRLDEAPEAILEYAITNIREKVYSNSKEIFASLPIDYPLAKVSVPQRGDKKKLLELSERNAKYFAMARKKMAEKANPNERQDRLLETMQKDLRLKEPPQHIEGFDNSNIQGTNPVAACVVFKNGKPAKRDYRKFNIKTVEGPDDFGSMREIIHRRYSRLMREGQSLPQLIVIDGGKGQLNAAVQSLDELGLRGKIAIVGIAKRLEEIYFADDPVPLYLDKNSPTLRVIQHIRNESHRFGITFHRDKRSQNFAKSALDDVPGIGPKTVEKLYADFKTLKGIQQASDEELSKSIGMVKAKQLMDHFKNKK